MPRADPRIRQPRPGRLALRLHVDETAGDFDLLASVAATDLASFDRSVHGLIGGPGGVRPTRTRFGTTRTSRAATGGCGPWNPPGTRALRSVRRTSRSTVGSAHMHHPPAPGTRPPFGPTPAAGPRRPQQPRSDPGRLRLGLPPRAEGALPLPGRRLRRRHRPERRRRRLPRQVPPRPPRLPPLPRGIHAPPADLRRTRRPVRGSSRRADPASGPRRGAAASRGGGGRRTNRRPPSCNPGDRRTAPPGRDFRCERHPSVKNLRTSP